MIIERDYDYEIDEKAAEISKESAEGRLEGLYDGWELALLNPVLGFGPGSSPVVRKQVNESLMFNTESEFQMHNVYGQILSETGFVGLIIFVITILVYLGKLRKVNLVHIDDDFYIHVKVFLRNYIFMFLYYGMIHHSLYQYYWFFIFAIHGGLMHILSPDTQKKKSIV